MRPDRGRLWLGASSLVLALPSAAAIVALVWQFPVFMVGNVGGDMNAAIGGALTAAVWMTLLTLFVGLAVAAAIGAGVGRVLVGRHWAWTPAATLLLALAVAVAAAAVAA